MTSIEEWKSPSPYSNSRRHPVNRSWHEICCNNRSKGKHIRSYNEGGKNLTENPEGGRTFLQTSCCKEKDAKAI